MYCLTTRLGARTLGFLVSHIRKNYLNNEMNYDTMKKLDIGPKYTVRLSVSTPGIKSLGRKQLSPTVILDIHGTLGSMPKNDSAWRRLGNHIDPKHTTYDIYTGENQMTQKTIQGAISTTNSAHHLR